MKYELQRSHDELRAVICLGGLEVRNRSIGRRDSPLLQLMRRTLGEARVVARAEGQQQR
jgi:hypothetical protein